MDFQSYRDMIDHETLSAYYKHPYWHELGKSQKEQFCNGVMDKYGKDCGLACYNYEFQLYVNKFESFFNELVQKLGIPSDL